MKKLYLLLFLFTGLSFSYGQLIINEVLYDPSNDSLDGDANGDGVYSQDDDSFIEFYNSGSSSIDLSGYEIWDDTTSGGTNQYTIPANTLLPAGEALVVFGGGTPTGTFGGSTVLNASTGLNFNNSGEVIGIKDANGNWVLFFDSDALSGNPNESYTRAPDVTGFFVQHGGTTAGTLFSPGTQIDGSSFPVSPPPMLSDIIINEVLYDPSNNALDGDANGDGVYGQDDDSFIELYNTDSTNSFDISGYEIWDDTASGGTNQYTFPAGTMIPAKEAVVVFGGGTITGTFGSAVVLNANNGFNFNNSGEVIGIKDANGNWVLTFNSDALSGNPDESYTRNPDVTGNFEQHSTNTSVLFTPGTKIDGSAFNTTPPPVTNMMIINEVLYDPSSTALEGDANRDGVYSQDDDSFIELYNTDSTNSFDISGYEIWDDTTSGGSNQFTFPSGTMVPAQEVIVVFGGGTPTGTFGSAVVQTAGNGFNFNNSGEVIGIKDPNGNWVLTFDSDALSNNPNESYTRNPDVTGNFEQHTDNTPLLFSPGTRVNGTPFSWAIGIEENAMDFDFSVYPNPAASTITIDSKENILTVEVLDLKGRLVKATNNFNKQINVSDLESGVYLLRARSRNSTSEMKFIKQ
ncbi:MAG: lamin tail domain-containing protein [Vicingaceae bacterium]